MGVVWTFFLSSVISLFFLPLSLSGRRPDIDCLKGPLTPKQPTNQSNAPPKHLSMCVGGVGGGAVNEEGNDQEHEVTSENK